MASLMAEFPTPELLLAAIDTLRKSGERRLNAYTPYAMPDVEEALGVRRSWIPYATLVSGLSGAALGFLLQLYLNGIAYPIVIGGFRPLSAFAFVPITFESTILVAVVGTVVALFVATRLPKLWHPAFEVPEFTSDGFWLAIDTDDTHDCAAKLRDLGATSVTDALPGVV